MQNTLVRHPPNCRAAETKDFCGVALQQKSSSAVLGRLISDCSFSKAACAFAR
jgi:hypothetical protein